MSSHYNILAAVKPKKPTVQINIICKNTTLSLEVMMDFFSVPDMNIFFLLVMLAETEWRKE